MSNNMENNILIAEFMGMNLHHNDKSMMVRKTLQGNEVLYIDKLEYHTSWDWLMPVVSKCLNVYHIEEKNDDLNFNFYDSIGNLEYTYKVVVEFIKEYNDGKQ